MTWDDDIRTALQQLGGRAHLRDIYPAVKAIRQQAGRSIPAEWQAAIRETLQRKSSDSENWDNTEDLFEMGRIHHGLMGFWSLRSMMQGERPRSRDYRRGYSAGWEAAMTLVRNISDEPPHHT